MKLKDMKKYFLSLFLLAFGLSTYAQNISVDNFYYAENDLTARTHGTSVEDQNGYLCALIKVETTEKGIWSFDVGMLGVTKTEMQITAHPAEIWVYVPYGVIWITIQHNKFGKLNHYKFPCSIEKGCTYIMKLNVTSPPPPPDDETTEQWLVFEITPHDAVLEVDKKMWPVSAEGTARNMMPFGTYTYQVQAQNYYTEVGKVEVNDSENSKVVTVKLKPNFGWIEVPGNKGLSGASVYIDNALIGKAPCKSAALKSGQHNVKILKEMYEPYSTSVTVKDNETTTVAPILTSDFARLTLKVDADAEIWVNDELKGTRTWTGNMPTGTYRVECKQKGHEATTTKITVNNSMNGDVITLQAPIPIYGSLNVDCTPDLATLYIDGKEMGKAPKLIGKILVGEHHLRLTKDGYKDYSENITIKKGERKQVTATLVAAQKPKTEKPKQQPQKPQQSTGSKTFVTVNMAYSKQPQNSFGVMFGSMKKTGWYVGLGSNFSFPSSDYECDGSGQIVSNSLGEYQFTGTQKTSRLAITAGAVLRVKDPLFAYVGSGYGQRSLFWELYDNNNNYGWAKNADYSYKGLAFDAGLMMYYRRFCVSAGLQTVGFKYMEAKFGVGLTF